MRQCSNTRHMSVFTSPEGGVLVGSAHSRGIYLDAAIRVDADLELQTSHTSQCGAAESRV
jgi:hypothetical protein